MKTALYLLVFSLLFAACSKSNDPAFTVTYETTVTNNAASMICYKKADGSFDTLYQAPGNFKYQFVLSEAPKSHTLALAIGTLQSPVTITAKISVNDSVCASYAGPGNISSQVFVTNP